MSMPPTEDTSSTDAVIEMIKRLRQSGSISLTGWAKELNLPTELEVVRFLRDFATVFYPQGIERHGGQVFIERCYTDTTLMFYMSQCESVERMFEIFNELLDIRPMARHFDIRKWIEENKDIKALIDPKNNGAIVSQRQSEYLFKKFHEALDEHINIGKYTND
jgi:hypothetical protein